MTGATSTRTTDVERATTIEQIGTIVGGVWLTVGLFVDGYAHTNIIDTATEDFFTPWHGIFYSGFLATAAWVAYIAFRRPGEEVLNRFPPGYRLSALGLVVFAIGGVADGIWHTVDGVEANIDALLSPPHLLLFVGIVLVITAPIRASWDDRSITDGWGQLAIPVVATLLVTALVAFFFNYAFGLSDNEWIGVEYIPETGQDEGWVLWGIPHALLSTVVLVAPVVYLLRRWLLPIGSIALIWVTVAALESIAFDGNLVAIPAALVGGVAFDLALRLPVPTRRQLVRLAAFVAPVVMWSIWMWLGRDDPGIAMPVAIWTGMIFFAGLAGLGLALLVYPQPVPGESQPA